MPRQQVGVHIVKFAAGVLLVCVVNLAGSPLHAQSDTVRAQIDSVRVQSDSVRVPWYQSIDVTGLVMANGTENFASPPSRMNRLRPYDVDVESFEIALVDLSIRREPQAGVAGFRVDLDAGPHIPEADHAFGLEMGKLDLRQAFLSYIVPVGNGLRIDGGKFVTPCGYEVIPGPDGINDNATRSFLFAYAVPITHTGIRVTYPFGEQLSVMIMGVNGWDNVVDNNGSPSAGGQIIWTPIDGSSVSLSGIIGPELYANTDNTRSVIDLTASSCVTDFLTLGVNADYGRERYRHTTWEENPLSSSTWRGLAGYAKLGIIPHLELALRAEVFDDPDGVRTGTAQTLHGYTVTPIWHVTEGLTVKADFRYDRSSESVFESNDRLPLPLLFASSNIQRTASFYFYYGF
jgi:hypothetical protein